MQTKEDLALLYSKDLKIDAYGYNITIEQECNESFIAGYEAAQRWIPVTECPLITKDEKGYWTCTEDGEREFMAAVPYNDSKIINNLQWWVKHCVIEDEIGLCVVGDDENTPAGWNVDCVVYWMPILRNTLPNL